MNAADLTPKHRQLILNMADLWVHHHGLKVAAESLTIAALMQDPPKEDPPKEDPPAPSKPPEEDPPIPPRSPRKKR